jgi:capsular exopolysaccharide synthesis family protein
MIETMIYNFNLARIVYVIRKYIAAIIAAACIGGILAGTIAFFMGSTIYRAEVSFYVYSNPDYVDDSSVNVSSNDFSAAKDLLESYTQVLKSDTVLNKVIENLGLNCKPEDLSKVINSEPVENTAVFYVYVDYSDPYSAMQIANAIADVAPSEITRIVKSGGIEVIDRAELPTEPYESVSLTKCIMLGALGAGAAALLISFCIGLLDATIRRKYEVTNSFTLPILGDIPENTTGQDTILRDDSPFVLRESYNLIRTNIMFTNKGVKCPLIAFTSAISAEGKTIACVNTAIDFSQLGKKILLIDGDMRYPALAKRLGMDTKREGLSEYLAGIAEKVNITSTDTEGVDLLSSGAVPPNPSELLATEKFSTLINDMKEKYDYIFLDLPPVNTVSDASMVINSVTSYCMVVRVDYSKLTYTKQAVGMLEQIGANICGFIYNGVSENNEDYRYKEILNDYDGDKDTDHQEKHKKLIRRNRRRK